MTPVADETRERVDQAVRPSWWATRNHRRQEQEQHPHLTRVSRPMLLWWVAITWAPCSCGGLGSLRDASVPQTLREGSQGRVTFVVSAISGDPTVPYHCRLYPLLHFRVALK